MNTGSAERAGTAPLFKINVPYSGIYGSSAHQSAPHEKLLPEGAPSLCRSQKRRCARFTVERLLASQSESVQLTTQEGHEKATAAQKLGATLWATGFRLSGLTKKLYFKLEGNFQYLKPRSAARHFTLASSIELSHQFAVHDEALRKEALEYFDKLCNGDAPFPRYTYANFVHGVHRCLNLEQEYSNWERKAGVSSESFMHELLIEGDKCPGADHRFFLEDEPGYLERSYRALLFLLNEVAADPQKPISIDTLIRCGAIVGTTLCSKNVIYGVDVDTTKHNPVFVDIVNNSFIKNTCQMYCDEFKERIESLAGHKVRIKNGYAYTDHVCDRFGKTGTYFVLKLTDFTPTTLYFDLKYKSPDKSADCQKILDRFYRVVATKTEAIDIIEEVVSTCCKLQRRHLFVDGNGRIMFFILMRCLLAQQGFRLRKTLENPWDMVDVMLPKKIAQHILPLCEKKPVNTMPVNWRKDLPEAEHIRLLCAMGEKDAFIRRIRKQPELLERTFAPSNLTLLEIAAQNNQKGIVDYILSVYPTTVRDATVKYLIINLTRLSHYRDIIDSLKAFQYHRLVSPAISQEDLSQL